MEAPDLSVDAKKPTVIVVIGMAGTGKTTLMKALYSHFTKPAIIPQSISPPAPRRSKDYPSSSTAAEVPSAMEDDPVEELTEGWYEIGVRDNKDQPAHTDSPTEASAAEPSSESAFPSFGTSKAEDIDVIMSPDPPPVSGGSSELPEAPGSSTSAARNKLRPYVMNLDPAVRSCPFPVNIDIRDTIHYKQVMKEYRMGPNGAIITSLNLFSTKFDQVLELLEKRSHQLDVVLIDTPGQIEAFNWSASGTIILESLGVSFPTVILYVVDSVRCQSPVSFMSNMIYACSVLYKTKFPFVMVFNKTDVQSAKRCADWMTNYDLYAEDAVREDSYVASLSRSCALAMNEFYEGIRSVGVSAATGVGLEALEANINEARKEYFREYLPWLTAQREAVLQKRQQLAEQSAKKFQEDRAADEERQEKGLLPKKPDLAP